MTISELKSFLLESDDIGALDVKFADFILHLNRDDNDALWICTVLVSAMTRTGHICLDCKALTDPAYLSTFFQQPVAVDADVTDALLDSNVVGTPGAFHPLILDESGRLYLYRYWDYQNNLAEFIKKSTQNNLTGASENVLEAFFPKDDDTTDEWQKAAARTALNRAFCVIAGGPGTGKTYTVGKILAALVESNNKPLKIKLAAPTGKAAVRLQESIRSVKTELECSDETKELLPEEAFTIHRLLGTKRHSPFFYHDATNPLDLDVLIIDEASMVDLALISKLVTALPQHARLILLGDNHQLASVEAGAVLADICGPVQPDPAAADRPAIADSIVTLRTTHRFSEDSGILKLSRAINAGDSNIALAILNDPEIPETRWRELKQEDLTNTLLRSFADYHTWDSPQAAFQQFADSRVLCAIRMGSSGVVALNNTIERYIKTRTGVAQDEEWYQGRPVLITENDYQIGLFNGDVGIAFSDSDSENSLRVWFDTGDGNFKPVRPFRLPEHETAFAMTVHKSQGSEFRHVLFVLPDMDNPLLTRELIYTATTRASESVEIWADSEIFKLALPRRIRRSSGLQDLLWQK